MSIGSSSRLFIHATNVHQGGGRSLLLPLLCAAPKIIQTVAQLDQRMFLELPSSDYLSIRYILPTVFRRLLAEIWLARTVCPKDLILCFGNLPPLFKVRARVVVFVQNRLLADSISLKCFPLMTRLRLNVERFWLRTRLTNASRIIVQTPSMKHLLNNITSNSIPVSVMPFIPGSKEYPRSKYLNQHRNDTPLSFAYVASGDAHKNHRCLVEAWTILAESGIKPILKLTLDTSRYPYLCNWIEEQKKKHCLNIENLGWLQHHEVMNLYSNIGALIYPSKVESFGLPLIEARQAGLFILASELDFVRDVIDPDETFDPHSALSISRSVKRYISSADTPLEMISPKDFINNILVGNE